MWLVAVDDFIPVTRIYCGLFLLFLHCFRDNLNQTWLHNLVTLLIRLNNGRLLIDAALHLPNTLISLKFLFFCFTAALARSWREKGRIVIVAQMLPINVAVGHSRTRCTFILQFAW